MQAHRLRAPKVDGSVLAEPPLGAALDTIGSNITRFSAWRYDFQGRPYAALRMKARSDAVAAAIRYHEAAGLDVPSPPDLSRPVVMSGHQPELFHPGVWIKNFAIAGIAARAGGTAINLIVDNDIPKGATIRVPDSQGGSLRTRPVAFDNWAGEIPFEDQPVRDEDLFRTFPDRVREALGSRIASPLVDHFWRHVATTPPEMPGADRVGRRFARARRLVEADWGVTNLELPLSDLCETDGFRWFACHILAQLARFRSVHNAALGRYRALYKIRSKNHPVAALARQGDWLEAPFWAWRADEPRRRPLLVRQNARTIDLRMGGEDEPFLQLPLAPDREACCAVEALRELPGRRIRLRTRALATTMFARFLLGDLFVHGIGGAKYDELGDEVARDFFSVTPPEFLTLSMTLHLGLPTKPATLDGLHAVERRLRDLSWQPERFVDGEPELAQVLAEKRRLVVEQPESKADRRARFRALRRCNDALTVGLDGLRAEAEAVRHSILAGLRYNEVARSREYSMVLYNEDQIREAMVRAGSP